MHINSNPYKIASREELEFIRHNLIRGMISLIVYRTCVPRWKVLYELERYPVKQDENIIQAAREILYVVTGLDFQAELVKRIKNHKI